MRHGRLPRFDLPHHTYYLTCCLHNRRPLLRSARSAQTLLDLYAGYRNRGDILLHGYVIMPDHYHVIVTLLTQPSVSGLVRRIHSAFARRWRCWAGDEAPALRERPHGRIWQRRFYDHVIRDEEDWRTKLSYMHGNPVQADLVDCATDHPWSSAAFWEAGTGPVTCDSIIW